MIISATPVRVSFLGGGTDYPAYYLRHGGATLATTIDKFVYVTVQPRLPFFDHTIQVHYSKVESVTGPDDLAIPNVREVLRYLGFSSGVEVHLMSDLPARTGLGTSSATTVGVLNALYGFRGEMVPADRLAQEAVHIEQRMVRERVGSQDQFTCAIGGLLTLEFCRDGSVRHQPLVIGEDRLRELEDHLMIVYTGQRRRAHEVLDEQIASTESGELDDRLAALRDLVWRAADVLTGSNAIRGVGKLLHEAWEIKRNLSSKISNPAVDDWYRAALDAGAVGGKLLGAGGGGFLLLFVEPGRKPAVREALPDLREVQFSFEPRGTRIVYHSR